jgi:hypothetical protein
MHLAGLSTQQHCLFSSTSRGARPHSRHRLRQPGHNGVVAVAAASPSPPRRSSGGGPDGFASTDAYDAERLRLDAQARAAMIAQATAETAVEVSELASLVVAKQPRQQHAGRREGAHQPSDRVAFITAGGRTRQQGGRVEVGHPQTGEWVVGKGIPLSSD